MRPSATKAPPSIKVNSTSHARIMGVGIAVPSTDFDHVHRARGVFCKRRGL